MFRLHNATLNNTYIPGKTSSRSRSSSKARADPSTADGSSQQRPRRRREASESSEVAQYTAASLRRQARSRTPAPGSTTSLQRHQPKRPLSAHGGNRLVESICFDTGVFMPAANGCRQSVGRCLHRLAQDKLIDEQQRIFFLLFFCRNISCNVYFV